MIGALNTLWTNVTGQVAGTFFAPGSPYSLAALGLSLLLFAALTIGRRRKRPVPLPVLLRAVFPRRLWRSASGRADLAWYIFGLLFAGLLIGWALLGAEEVRGWTLGLIGAPGQPWLPRWASGGIATVALFLAYELAYYVDHWLMHRVPALWALHKVHHQADSLSLLTNARVHPLESIGFYNLVALLLGVTGAVLQRLLGTDAVPWSLGGTDALILLTAVCITHLQHSHLWLTFGPRWGRLLLGPAHHQIHHSTDPAHFNRNLGSSLALFDRLFGTLHLPEERPESLRFGVEDDAANPHGIHAALVAPVVGAWDALKPSPPVDPRLQSAPTIG